MAGTTLPVPTRRQQALLIEGLGLLARGELHRLVFGAEGVIAAAIALRPEVEAAAFAFARAQWLASSFAHLPNGVERLGVTGNLLRRELDAVRTMKGVDPALLRGLETEVRRIDALVEAARAPVAGAPPVVPTSALQRLRAERAGDAALQAAFDRFETACAAFDLKDLEDAADGLRQALAGARAKSLTRQVDTIVRAFGQALPTTDGLRALARVLLAAARFGSPPTRALWRAVVEPSIKRAPERFFRLAQALARMPRPAGALGDEVPVWQIERIKQLLAEALATSSAWYTRLLSRQKREANRLAHLLNERTPGGGWEAYHPRVLVRAPGTENAGLRLFYDDVIVVRNLRTKEAKVVFAAQVKSGFLSTEKVVGQMSTDQARELTGMIELDGIAYRLLPPDAETTVTRVFIGPRLPEPGTAAAQLTKVLLPPTAGRLPSEGQLRALARFLLEAAGAD